MTKTKIADWLTPGLAHIRLVFTTWGGSAHGTLSLEVEDIETGEWSHIEDIGDANGCPSVEIERVSDTETINQFTGERSD